MADLEGAPPVIATFDHTDLEDLGGTVKYYFYQSRDSAGTYYLLGKDNPYSEILGVDTSASSTEWNFDTGAFNTTRVVGGTLTFNMSVHSVGATGGIARVYIRVLHYDGSTETELGTWASFGIGESNSPYDQTLLGKIEIPNTRFKRGDVLRVELIFAHDYGAGQKVIDIPTDPQNRDYKSVTPSTDADQFTSSYIMIPFRIDD